MEELKKLIDEKIIEKKDIIDAILLCNISLSTPEGLIKDTRASKIGIEYTIPKESRSAYPNNRQFTVGANERLKTTSVGFMKSHPAKTASGNRRLNDPTGWYMSEKLDGLRGLWDGSVFISSGGTVPYFIPDWIKELMPPSIPLDGEVWIGRDKFSGTGGVTGIFAIKPGNRRKYSQEAAELKWMNITYNAFDVPDYPGVFEDRIKFLEQVIEARCKWWPYIQKKYYDILIDKRPKVAKALMEIECPLKLATQTQIKDEQHFQEVFQDILDNDGEGLIVRKPGSYYEGKRSTASLKYKQIDDSECKVIGIIPGKSGSKYDRVVYDKNNQKGYPVMGAILCIRTDALGNPILKNGRPIEFKIGTGFSDKFRENYWNPSIPDYYIFNPDLKEGAVITYTYMKINTESGHPREPRYHRIRHVIDDFTNESVEKLVPVIPETVEELRYRLIRDFSIISLVAQLKGDRGIGNRKRIEVYQKSIGIVDDMQEFKEYENEEDNLVAAIVHLKSEFTKAPSEKMMKILTEGLIRLDKEPYNGVVVINGSVDDKDLQKRIESIVTLEPLLKAKVGIGASRIRDLINLGYSDLSDLENYKEDNRIPNGIKKSLQKFFEGSARIKRMSWEDADEWKKTIVSILKEIKPIYPKLKGTMAGSYSRKENTIGDIDYVITHPDPDKLYEISDYLLKSLDSGKSVSNKKISIKRIDELPNPLNKGHQFIKLWMEKEGSPTQIKVEIYGYVQKAENFIFAVLARSAKVDFQKKIRYKASKMGYSLSEKGLKDTRTGKLLEKGDTRLLDKLKKPYFKTLNDLYEFLEFNILNLN